MNKQLPKTNGSASFLKQHKIKPRIIRYKIGRRTIKVFCEGSSRE